MTILFTISRFDLSSSNSYISISNFDGFHFSAVRHHASRQLRRSAARPPPRAAPVRNPPQPASHAPPPAPTQSGGGCSLGGICSTIAQGQPSTVSLVNSVVKESNVVGSSKADIGKETKESLGFDPKFQVTTISQSFSVSSPHFEPSNKVDFLALMSVFRVDHRD